MTTTTACFRVDGDWLADFARTRFDEGAWDKAIEFLTASLDGISIDQAVAIIKGEATLTGNSSDEDGIEYMELPKDGDIAKGRQHRADWMYSDLFRIGDVIWRPYAVVSGWCAEDHMFAAKDGPAVKMLGNIQKEHGHRRSMFYANQPYNDLLVVVPQRNIGGDLVTDVICERFTGSVPFWYKLSQNDPVNFIDNLMKTKNLEKRGAFISGFEDVVKSADIEPTKLSEIIHLDGEMMRIAPAGSFDEDDEGEDAKALMNNIHARSLWQQLLKNVEEFVAGENIELYDLKKVDMQFEAGIDRVARLITNDDWDRVEALRSKIAVLENAGLQKAVIDQAEKCGGFYDLPLMKNGEPWTERRFIRVPKNPFILWALRNVDFEAHGHQRPEWKHISERGMKMGGDDPHHTDWMLGAGIPLDKTYDNDENSLAYIVRHSSFLACDELMKEYTGHQFTVLSKGAQSTFIGDVVFPKPNERVAPGSIAVVPHAGPEYQLAMETANMENSFGRRGCLIAETGGKLAHLAVVGREFKCTVLMMPGVMSMYSIGDTVEIDMEDGVIKSSV